MPGPGPGAEAVALGGVELLLPPERAPGELGRKEAGVPERAPRAAVRGHWGYGLKLGFGLGGHRSFPGFYGFRDGPRDNFRLGYRWGRGSRFLRVGGKVRYWRRAGRWRVAVVGAIALGWGIGPGLPKVIAMPIGQGRKRLIGIEALLTGRTGGLESGIEAKPEAASRGR
jgi:hypothetical protein